MSAVCLRKAWLLHAVCDRLEIRQLIKMPDRIDASLVAPELSPLVRSPTAFLVFDPGRLGCC